MSQHIISLRTNYLVFGALLALLALTIGAAYIDLGPWNFPLAMAIAAAKATLILLFFMHVKFSRTLTSVFATAGFLWLAILIALTMNDYLSRAWLPIQGK